LTEAETKFKAETKAEAEAENIEALNYSEILGVVPVG